MIFNIITPLIFNSRMLSKIQNGKALKPQLKKFFHY